METDEQAIIDQSEKFSEAWSEGDYEKAASFYTEDGVRIGAYGDEQHGRKEIAEAYEKLLHETMPGARLEQSRGEVRMICPGHAILRNSIKITTADGTAMKGDAVSIMKQVDESWMFLESHPKLYPPR